MHGYMGKILRIDLTHEKIEVESIDSTIARSYIGGRGLGAYLAYKEISPNVDPFSKDSKALVILSLRSFK